ncbi:MAG TPA: hemolysin family protein [Chloroflexota bacterium]
MDVPLWLSAAGLAASLFGATLAAASLAAFMATSRARVRDLAEDGLVAARRLLPLTERPGQTAAALAAADALLVTAVVVWGYVLAGAPEAPRAGASVLIVVAIVLLLLSQAAAWVAGIARPELVGLRLAGVAHALALLFCPVVAVAARGPWGARPAAADGEERELQRLVEVVEENKALEAGERKMIHGIVELGDRTVREVMVPRIDMVAVSQTAPVAVALERIYSSGHSRIPVYGEGIDDIVGILYAKDLLHQVLTTPRDAPVGPLVRPAHFVPETKRVDELLHEMQEMKVHMAIVVDEYGGTAGLITIEDLLEEIVGEIRDEYDVGEETWIEPVNDHEAIFDARVSIHDVNQTLPLELDDAEYDTLGGLVYARLGKVPAQGDEVRVDKATVSVLSTAGRRIRKVRVRVEPPPPNGNEG